MDSQTLDVLGLHRAEFELAKSDQSRAWWSEGAIAATTLISVIFNQPQVGYTTAILALVAAVLKATFSCRSAKRRDVAERARRVLSLVEGLDYQISKKELVDILASFSAPVKAGRNWEEDDYFPPAPTSGDQRFFDVLQESAFFSRHLYGTCARNSRVWFVAALLVSAIALLVLPNVGNPTWSVGIAYTVNIVLMFLVAIDLLGRAIRFSEASSQIAVIDEKLEGMQDSDVSKGHLVLIWGDYNALVQGAPLIPTTTYKRQKDRLNTLFAKRLDHS